MGENLSSQVSFYGHVCLPCAVTKEIKFLKTFKAALKIWLHSFNLHIILCGDILVVFFLY